MVSLKQYTITKLDEKKADDMGLTKKKIRIRREDQGDQRAVYIDFYKVASKIELISGLLKDIIGDKHCLAVIDSSLSYSIKDVKKSTEELYQLLNQQAISYRSIMVKNDLTTNVLGIQIKSNSKRMVHHKIGFIMSIEDIVPLLSINQFNIFFYLQSDSIDPEEVLNRFQSVHGDLETMEECFDMQLYLDNYMRILKLVYPKNYDTHVEQLISRTS